MEAWAGELLTFTCLIFILFCASKTTCLICLGTVASSVSKKTVLKEMMVFSIAVFTLHCFKRAKAI